MAENLVRVHYGYEPIYRDTCDDGYDFVDKGRKVDIKATIIPFEYHNMENSYFTIKNYKPLVADYFIFAKIDPLNKACSLIGWNSLDEVLEFGEQVFKGERHSSMPDPVANDALFLH